MQRTIIAETLDKIDQEVLLKGWIRIVRSHGKLVFFDLRDGSGVVQVVANRQVSDEAYKIAVELHPEYAVEVVGLVKKTSKN
jgi:aspartyl-tRNA synthetase